MSSPFNDLMPDPEAAARKWHCCDMMAYHAEYRCEQHPDPFECPDNIVYFDPKSRTYGLIIHDGGGALLDIDYCPWCGTMLSGARHSVGGGWPIQ